MRRTRGRTCTSSRSACALTFPQVADYRRPARFLHTEIGACERTPVPSMKKRSPRPATRIIRCGSRDADDPSCLQLRHLTGIWLDRRVRARVTLATSAPAIAGRGRLEATGASLAARCERASPLIDLANSPERSVPGGSSARPRWSRFSHDSRSRNPELHLQPQSDPTDSPRVRPQPS